MELHVKLGICVFMLSTIAALISPVCAQTPTTTLSDVDMIIHRINDIVCFLLDTIWLIIGLLATLALIVYGIEYMTTEDIERRNDIRGRISHIFIGLIIVLVALPVINYLIDNTNILPFECDDEGWVPPPQYCEALFAASVCSDEPGEDSATVCSDVESFGTCFPDLIPGADVDSMCGAGYRECCCVMYGNCCTPP